MRKISNERGFTKTIVLAVVVIATLAYFNIDLRAIFENPITQKIWHILVVAWNNYLEPMFTYLWTSISALFN